jgi:hypothetical protein
MGDNQESSTECYMVSDQCQALERDNVFGHSENLKTLCMRQPNEYQINTSSTNSINK